MKNLLKFMVAAMLMLAVTTGCEKTTCAECKVETNAPGASEYYNYCGTQSEISAESTKLKNGCVTLKADYPQYTFNCGCQ